jgi:hypothetical protein
MKLLKKINCASRRLAALICLVCGLVSCDVLEPDADIITPTTEIVDKEIVVLANSPAFIDLNSKFETNIPAYAAVTSQPRLGKLKDFGNGIIQYTPAVGNSKGRDNFEFTLYTTNNEIIKRDTLTLIIENDSTGLPCGIYPKADYAYSAGTTPILIDVVANDIICGGPVNVSIFQPNEKFPPQFGKAEITNKKIRYTPSIAFGGSDIIIYKLANATDTTRQAYGVVFVTADSVCNYRISDDHFVFKGQSLDSTFTLPVFINDSLCDMISQYQAYAKSLPVYGKVSTIAEGFAYIPPASPVFPFEDHFTYEVCKDGMCKSAKVNVTLKIDSIEVCQLSAKVDTIYFSNNNISMIYMDVLANDTICGVLKSLKILKSPQYGIATVEDSRILYKQDPLMHKDDELEYEICNSERCRKTKVFIKRTT